MARFAARRLLGMLAVLFAVSVIVFLIFNVIPNSDPAARIAGEKSAGNAQLIANINEEWGFDEPLPQPPDEDAPIIGRIFDRRFAPADRGSLRRASDAIISFTSTIFFSDGNLM